MIFAVFIIRSMFQIRYSPVPSLNLFCRMGNYKIVDKNFKIYRAKIGVFKVSLLFVSCFKARTVD